MKRIYPKEEVCVNCHLCQVYCLVEHSKSKDILKAYKREKDRAMPGVQVAEKGNISFAVQCRHCKEPVCVYSCITGAMRKDPVTGVVTVDSEKCIGCWTCVLVCPHGAPIPDYNHEHVVKCDLCPGRKTPVCVENCPNEALLYVEEPVSS